MENNKKFEFTNEDIVDIEWVLTRSLILIHESPNPYTIKGNVQEYVIQYCLDRGYPLRETIEKANEVSKGMLNIQMKDIVPESKRGQEHLVRGTLFSMLNKSGAIWDEGKTDEMVTSVCELTGISKDMVTPIISTMVKQRKRDVIEKEAYSFLRDTLARFDTPDDRKAVGEEIIQAFAEQLHVEPKYIKGVLKAKKKKDEAEAKRVAEYMAKKEGAKPSGGTNLDDSDGDAR